MCSPKEGEKINLDQKLQKMNYEQRRERVFLYPSSEQRETGTENKRQWIVVVVLGSSANFFFLILVERKD